MVMFSLSLLIEILREEPNVSARSSAVLFQLSLFQGS